MPRRRCRRSNSGRCWGSSSAAAPAWCMPRRSRPAIRGRRSPVSGNCRAAAGSRTSATACRPRSTPPCDRHQRAGLCHQPGSELDKDEVPGNVTARLTRDQVERGKISVAKLRHPGGCDAAPRALVNLMEAAARELKDLRVEVHPSCWTSPTRPCSTIPWCSCTAATPST